MSNQHTRIFSFCYSDKEGNILLLYCRHLRMYLRKYPLFNILNFCLHLQAFIDTPNIPAELRK